MSTVTINGGMHAKRDSIVNVTDSQPVAQYHTQQIGRAPTPWDLDPPALPVLLLSTLVGLFNYLGGLASILSWFQVSPPSIEHVKTIAWMLAIGFGGIAGLSLLKAYTISKNRWSRWLGQLYVREDDNSVAVYCITAKCPIKGCPGTLQLKRPALNEEGVVIAGICSHHPKRHMYEFNDETYEGSRIERLTPIEKRK